MRHEALCAGFAARAGRPCAKIGHWLGGDGRRWCGTHRPPEGEIVKSAYACAGLNAAGDPCTMTADAVETCDEGELALCQHHLALYADLGVTQTPKGYAKQRRQRRENGSSGDPLLDELDEEGVARIDRIRQRLAGLPNELSDAVLKVIKDALKAKRWITVVCTHCGRRFRVETADMAIRLTASKYATDIGAPPPETAAGAAAGTWAEDPIAVYGSLDNVPTAVLAATAYPSRAEYVRSHYEDGTLQREVHDLQQLHRRYLAGERLAPDELERARTRLVAIKTVHGLLAPAATLSFDGAPAHP